jgi:hypothetical protein
MRSTGPHPVARRAQAVMSALRRDHTAAYGDHCAKRVSVRGIAADTCRRRLMPVRSLRICSVALSEPIRIARRRRAFSRTWHWLSVGMSAERYRVALPRSAFPGAAALRWPHPVGDPRTPPPRYLLRQSPEHPPPRDRPNTPKLTVAPPKIHRRSSPKIHETRTCSGAPP